jgi:hypothetical protein
VSGFSRTVARGLTMSQPFLTPEIVDLAVAAPGLPEGIVGWTLESLRRAIDALRSSKIAIVDLEVYDRVVWGFAPSGESWNCQRLPNESASDFALRSRDEARKWLDAFPRSEVLFVIQFSAQDFAAEASGA